MQNRALLLLFFCSLFLFFNYLQQYTFSISNAFVRNTAMKMEKKKKEAKAKQHPETEILLLEHYLLSSSFFLHSSMLSSKYYRTYCKKSAKKQVFLF